ncbi:hypothetical protein ACH4E7_39230 [Kitasatospora sp. NPDC018058]|uniref:hypothetical protein n=1 Tax=Kitasatospora sp. NPDC018058 TaxID=3364025 RepID=UPI0037C0326D
MVPSTKQTDRVTEPGDPGGRTLATVRVAPGWNPWLSRLVIDVFGTVDEYEMTLTEHMLCVHELTLVFGHPGRQIYAMPRKEAAQRLVRVKRDAKVSAFWFLEPGRSKPTRMSVRHQWRHGFDAFTAALGAQAGLR